MASACNDCATSSSSRSILFITRRRGFFSASSSFRTISTCASCSAESRLLASDTCKISDARCTSSSVARNAETNVCGRLRMNPTVSDIRTLRFEGRSTPRMVGSSVANMRGDSSTLARVSERRLPRIGVADERTRRDGRGLAPLPLLPANAPHVFQLLLHVPDAPGDLPPVSFKLGFTGTAGANAAAELGHLHAMPGQPRHHVLQLRQFDLQLAFAGARMPRKNIENELGAVDNPPLDDLLNIALLGRTEIVIE